MTRQIYNTEGDTDDLAGGGLTTKNRGKNFRKQDSLHCTAKQGRIRFNTKGRKQQFMVMVQIGRAASEVGVISRVWNLRQELDLLFFVTQAQHKAYKNKSSFSKAVVHC